MSSLFLGGCGDEIIYKLSMEEAREGATGPGSGLTQKNLPHPRRDLQ